MKKVFTVQSRHILLVVLFFLGVFLLMQSWRPFYLEVHHCITSTLWIVKRLKSEFCFEVATSRCPIGFKISSYTRAKSFKYFLTKFYDTQFFTHSDWLHICKQPIRMRKKLRSVNLQHWPLVGQDQVTFYSPSFESRAHKIRIYKIVKKRKVETKIGWMKCPPSKVATRLF